MTAAALAAALLLVGATSAWAAFVSEGSPYTVGNDPYSLNAGDFNGDGRPDVATINGTSSDVSVFLRQAGGGFAQEAGSPISVGSGPSGAAVGDYDGDGRTDLAVSNFVDGTVWVLRRQPSGGFAVEGSPIALGTRVKAIAAGDFNSDGRLDLAAAEHDANQVVILLRNPQNTGFSQQQAATGMTPYGIAVGDYNGDRRADLAIVNHGDGTATILLQLAGGGFRSETAVPVGADSQSIVAADFDGNGRADLAVTNAAPGTVSTFLRRPANDGFTAQSPVAVSAAPVGLAAGDFDRDGRPDLAVASNSGAVNILRRNAGGGFTRDPAIGLAGAVNGVAVADFNGDSLPDVAASSYTNAATADTFSVLLNQAPPTQGPTLPPPVAGKSVNVEPVSGTVKIKRPRSKRFVTLTGEAHIPVGSTIDTRRGRITITVAQGRGKTTAADFFLGLFKLTQTKRAKPLTTLTLTERLSCPRKGAATTARKKKKRRLWGDGKGRFRTKGKHSAATVVGTRWLVEDRCSSTLTRVARGKVKVRDFAKRKTVTVRAGKRYIARAKRR